jgi:hypothetical protein
VQRPGATIKYLRRTTSAAADNGLGNTINEKSLAMHNERRRGQRPGHYDQVSATHNERRRGQRYLRCTINGAAGDGLGTTIMYLRAAAGIGLGNTIKYMRRTTSGAAGNVLCTTIKYLHRAAGIGLGTTI